MRRTPILLSAVAMLSSAAVPAARADSLSPDALTSVPGLPPAALKVMNGPAYRGAQWFISVRDVTTGRSLISLNADTFAQPGSVVKTYSMGAGWLYFGPRSHVVTPVKHTGRVVSGTLRGDLILVGKGDMTMDGRTKPNGTVDYTNLDHNDANQIPGATLTPENPLTGLNKLARQVRASGIRRVSGNVIVDDRLWKTFHLENGPVTPIDINQNLIDYVTRPGRVGAVASIRMRPKVAPWTVTSRVTTVAAGKTTHIDVSSTGHGRIVLSGTIAKNSRPVVNTYAFDDPATYARTAFIEALQRAGVTVSANPTAVNPAKLLPSRKRTAKLQTIARLRSLPLAQEAKYVLKVSYNRGGQMMLCRLAAAAGSTDCDAGLAKAQQILAKAGLDTRNDVLIDGSGLSGNLITADNQVQLETIMSRAPEAAAWQSALPILGVDGSLAQVQTHSPAAGKIFAKTGTLAGGDLFNGRLILPTKALGGYIDARSGQRLAFAIIVTNSVFSDLEGVFAANDDVGKVAAIIQQAY
jgi:serine-type D-Ala-D-Ala carboxypeptidase/endopeptidase (penicillin-binding protein 4)